MSEAIMVWGLLACGVVGSIGFMLTFTIDGATRPGYDARRHPISALALGTRGRLQMLNFVISGVLIALGAFGVGLAAGSLLFAAVVGVFGLALTASGIYPMDPMRGYPPGTPNTTPETTSARHTRHDHAGAVVFTTLPLAAFVAAAASDQAAWQLTSAATGVWTAGWSVAFSRAWERDDPSTGLLQRLVIGPGLLWLAATFALQ